MKIIIENRSDLSISKCLEMVEKVIIQGRISNNGKQYCYASSFSVGMDEYMIVTDLNKKSDRFIISKYPRPEEK